MPLPILTTVTIEPPIKASKRAIKEATREGHRKQGETWFREMLKDHFIPSARQRFHHKPRKRTWIKRKIKAAQRGEAIKGGLVDNVFTGLMERLLTSHRSIKAFPTRVTITLFGPSYIRMQPRDPNKPHKAAEIFTVARDQEQRLTDVLDRVTHKELASVPGKETHAAR